MLSDTIAAIATPPGTGGVAIVRVSGPGARDIAGSVFTADGLEHAKMEYGRVRSGEHVIDTGYAVMFFAPHSYTGEDTLELHVHGGAVSTKRVLDTVLKAGARLAEPGEFTKRSFLNGKMDLTQAEGVGDLIGALSDAAAELAIRQANGILKQELIKLQDVLTDIIAETEAVLEYPEEDLDETDTSETAKNLEYLSNRLRKIANTADNGAVIKNGLRVTLAGAANAGKSSLFNRLCGYDKAIVTNIPGTTRDVVDQTINLRGAAIHLSDTAGMRETSDIVESEGVQRSQSAIRESQLVLFLIDASDPDTPEAREAWKMAQEADPNAQFIVVMSKADLMSGKDITIPDFVHNGATLYQVSATTGHGMEDIEDLLYEKSCVNALSEETVLLSDMRQKEHIARAASLVDDAADVFGANLDLDCACIDLRSAWQEIGCVTGNAADERIIDRIFSKFCLGK